MGEMSCDVIMPIGPGHEEIHKRAVMSVQIACVQPGPFDTFKVRVCDDTKGVYGRGEARNRAAAESEADWLFFLDADDLMDPYAFRHVHAHVESKDAVFGIIQEFRDACVVPRYQVPWIGTYGQLISVDPYLTIQMGHFVKREVFQALKFNTAMDTGEDWDYYLRLWKNHACMKIDRPFMINDRSRHSTGPRGATGVDWRSVVDPMLAAARAELAKEKAH